MTFAWEKEGLESDQDAFDKLVMDAKGRTPDDEDPGNLFLDPDGDEDPTEVAEVAPEADDEDEEAPGDPLLPAEDDADDDEDPLAGIVWPQEVLDRVPEKFRNDPVKLIEAYQELEKELGRRGTKIDQLEKRMEAIESSASAPEPVQPQLLWTEQVQEALENAALDLENQGTGEKAALWVIQNMPENYERYLKIWAQHDTGSAVVFDGRYREWKLQQEAQEAAEAARMAASQSQNIVQLRAQVYEQVKDSLPGIDNLWSQMEKVAEEDPALLAGFDQNDPDSIARAYRRLYLAAKGYSDGPVNAAQKKASKDAADEARAAKLAARGLPSGRGGQGKGSKPRTPAEVATAAFAEPERTSISSGWTGR